jgi:beta-glucanase (GH16 family)
MDGVLGRGRDRTFGVEMKSFIRVLRDVVVGVVTFAAIAVVADSVFADPPQGARWVVIPELTDEFKGESLDTAKWHDHNPGWKGRKPGLFLRRNVSVGDGKLHLTARLENVPDAPDGYHTFTTAAVKSKALVKFGYFEIKCQPMKSGASSAFWFYHKTSQIWTEIDVFEIGGAVPGHQRTVHMNLHVFHTPEEKRHWSKSGRWDAPFVLADGFHVYALEWDAKQITFCVDGRPVHSVENTHWHQPLQMNFDSETMPEWFGLPKAEDLPSTFSIEYVRSWRRAE